MKPRAAAVIVITLSAALTVLLLLTIFPAVLSVLPRHGTAVHFVPVPAGTAAPATQNPDGLAINTATFEDLLTLPGIGPVTANAILTARAAHLFLYPEDLKAVPGIGDRTLEKIRDLIRVP